MEPEPQGDITQLLKAHRAGDRGAFDELVTQVYEQLRRMARQQLRRMHGKKALDTVGLVHEAYLRLVEQDGVDWQNRAHFYGVTARAMRWIVVDQARRQYAQKRGGDQRFVTLTPELASFAEEADAVLAVNGAIDLLASFNERLAKVVECRFFAGMNDEEVAEALGVSSRTVQRDWLRAQAWLQKTLADKPA
jgi:RNA polymerase sigma-70 factor, ECF subfamily